MKVLPWTSVVASPLIAYVLLTSFLGQPPFFCPTQKPSRSPAPAQPGKIMRDHTVEMMLFCCSPFFSLAHGSSGQKSLFLGLVGWTKLVAISKLSFKKILLLAIGQVAAQGPLGGIAVCKY